MVMTADKFYGNGRFANAGEPWTLTKGSGRWQRRSPSLATTITLPPKADCDLGGPWFFIQTANGVNLGVKDGDTGTTLFTLTSNANLAEIFLTVRSTGARAWRAVIH